MMMPSRELWELFVFLAILSLWGQWCCGDSGGASRSSNSVEIDFSQSFIFNDFVSIDPHKFVSTISSPFETWLLSDHWSETQLTLSRRNTD
jgi:hypothetical protein